MAKDKIIGLIIMIVGILIAVFYTLGSIVDLYMETLGGIPNGFTIWPFDGVNFPDLFSWQLFVVATLWLIVVLVGIIAIWIGWSMLTTPAPVPLEELEEELEAEEE